MQYTEAEILERGMLYQSILETLQKSPVALTVAQIAEETGLDESEVQQALSDLDEVHKVRGEVLVAREIAAQVGCSVEEVRAELGGDVVVIPDLYTVLG